jgi:hypothetical protein
MRKRQLEKSESGLLRGIFALRTGDIGRPPFGAQLGRGG